MLNQWREEIADVAPGDIVTLHGRKVVVAEKPQSAAVAYKGEIHQVVEVVGLDVATMRPFLGLAVPDQRVTVIR